MGLVFVTASPSRSVAIGPARLDVFMKGGIGRVTGFHYQGMDAGERAFRREGAGMPGDGLRYQNAEF